MEEQILELIKKTSTTLPEDIFRAIEKAKKNEEKNSNAAFALDTIEKNISLAQKDTVPLCQDTGFTTFFVKKPENTSENEIKKNIISATKKATKQGFLRPNAVDSITGKNSGDNCGEGFPKIIFSTGEKNSPLKISLLLKGGGSENVSAQVALPMETDFGKAGRNVEGVKKAVLQIVKNAEGKGCAPGILGVHIGGDRSSGYEYAKKNFFREIGNRSKISELKNLEEEILEEGNNLNIGPMGFGGKSTLLEVFCSASHRVPASFFVTVSYGCWAMRRGSTTIMNYELRITNSQAKQSANSPTPVILGRSDSEDPGIQINNEEKTPSLNKAITDKNIKKLSLPLCESDVRNLKVGDRVELSGTMYTGRDALHHAVVEEGKNLPIDISGSAIYHCGPVMMQKENGEWKCLSAGPTTSIREEPYEAGFIEKTGVRAIIGKGGMGEKTQKALQKFGAVYLHAIGGAAAVYAEKITSVPNVYFLDEFGIPEAMWEMEVKNFPVIVTMSAE
jgi:fumarate hydratase class I